MTETRKPYEKKGQFAGAVGAVITLIVGVGVSVLVLIFVGALGGQTYNLVEPDLDLISQSATTAFTASNTTAATLRAGSINQGSLSVSNGTHTIGLGNFTVDYGNPATIQLTGPSIYNAKAMNASFTFGDADVENSVKNSIVSGFAALEQTGNYLPIIVLAVVIALVLMLVLGFTAFGGGGDGGSRSAL